jgi:hypothetical protein
VRRLAFGFFERARLAVRLQSGGVARNSRPVESSAR